MGGGAAEPANAHEHTPLSVPFRDSAFTSFVNEADARGRDSPRTAGPPPSSHGQHAGAVPQGGELGLAAKNGTPQHQTAKPTPQADTGNSMGTNGDDGGGDDWDELDDLELDSQTMRQLVETEEQFYATQQFMASADLPLTQELTDTPGGRPARIAARATSAGGVHVPRSAQTVPSPAAQSVPVTPASAPLAYISDSDSSTRYSGNGPAATRGPRTTVPAGGSSDPPPHWPPPGQQQPGTARRKANLFPRLAAHMPPRLGDGALGPRPPPLGHPPSAAPGGRTNSFQQHATARRMQSPTRSMDVRFDVATSVLVSPARAHATHQHPAQHSVWRQQQQQQQQQSSDSNSVLEELKRLREENIRMRADQDLLRAQLYTKEGEVKIVRENLTRTEIENTHLQERLANQIASSAASQAQVETGLKAEIERLRTELLFQQHEAKTVATPSTKTPVRRPSARSVSTAGTPASFRGARSGSNGYPSIEDFNSTPVAPSSVPESTPSRASKSQTRLKLPHDQAAAGSPDKRARQADETAAQLLKILAGIAKRPSAEFGQLMLLAVQLSETARDDRPCAIEAFHAQACAALGRASEAGRFELLEAVLRLLLQTIDSLPEIRDRWLLDEAGSTAGGPRRALRVVDVVCATLRTSVAAAAGLRRASTGSAACGRAIAAHVELLLRVAAQQPAAALDRDVWGEFSPCELAAHFTAGLHLRGLSAVLELLAALIQSSPATWSRLRGDPAQFERLLLSVLKRLRLAFVADEARILDSQRKLLVLVAAAILTHEEDSRMLINAMPQFAVALVRWFLDEHAALVGPRADGAAEGRRAGVFCELLKCLNVVLSEVADVAVLLGGDSSPLFFAFVAATTRMTFGEGPFVGQPDARELAADLLAFVVTEEQALAIQGLADFS
ncbi:hypothetical protein LPJ61_000188 [Coemansia biformis]|uniref:Uncharacterized protein n=1 Tax=Coemansia biformis TaxID=1286918 RepID=A0A9W7YC44_9FUNG|nr:hypothetical protein LPJ61_000188 [Coemansia biformis]